MPDGERAVVPPVRAVGSGRPGQFGEVGAVGLGPVGVKRRGEVGDVDVGPAGAVELEVDQPAGQLLRVRRCGSARGGVAGDRVGRRVPDQPRGVVGLLRCVGDVHQCAPVQRAGGGRMTGGDLAERGQYVGRLGGVGGGGGVVEETPAPQALDPPPQLAGVRVACRRGPQGQPPSWPTGHVHAPASTPPRSNSRTW